MAVLSTKVDACSDCTCGECNGTVVVDIVSYDLSRAEVIYEKVQNEKDNTIKKSLKSQLDVELTYQERKNEVKIHEFFDSHEDWFPTCCVEKQIKKHSDILLRIDEMKRSVK